MGAVLAESFPGGCDEGVQLMGLAGPIPTESSTGAAGRVEPGIAAIGNAVTAARREAISPLLPGHLLSFCAELLPQCAADEMAS